MDNSITGRIKTLFNVSKIPDVEDLANANPDTNYYYMKENVERDSIEKLKQYLEGKTLILINTVDKKTVDKKVIMNYLAIPPREFNAKLDADKKNYLPIRVQSNFGKTGNNEANEYHVYYVKKHTAKSHDIENNDVVQIVKAKKGGGKTKRRKQKKKKQRRSSKK